MKVEAHMHDYVKHIKADDPVTYYDVTFIISQDLEAVHIVQGPTVITLTPEHKHWKIVSEEDFGWIKDDVKKDSTMLRNLLYVIKRGI